MLVLDGSKHAELAIPYAEGLTKALNSRLLLLHLKKHLDDDKTYTEDISREIASALGQLKLKTAEVVGEASAGIINYAEQNSVGMVVIATHSRTGILLWPAGNIAFRVLEGLTMPLLTIKVQATGPEHIENIMHRIVVPLDGSMAGEAALPYAVSLARRLKSDLHLLNIVEPGQHVHTLGGISYVRFLPEQVSRLKEEAESYLDGVKKSITGVKDVSIVVRTGLPNQEINKFALEVKSELVALSTAGYKGAFGSVFRRTMQSACCHIMAVRPAD